MKKYLWALVACFCANFVWGDPVKNITFPAYTGDIVDEVNLLDSASRQQIQTQINQLQNFKLAVVVLKDTRGLTLDEYGYQLGRHWGVGNAKTNNGVLFIVVPSARKVRIENGYGVEGVLTDAQSGIILDNYVLPYFKKGDLPGGMVSGTRAIVGHLNGKKSIERTISTDSEQALPQGNKQPRKTTWSDIGIVFAFAIFFLSFFVFVFNVEKIKKLSFLTVLIGTFFLSLFYLLIILVCLCDAEGRDAILELLLQFPLFFLFLVIFVALCVKYGTWEFNGRSGGHGGGRGGFSGGGGGSFGGGGAGRGW